MRQAWGGGIFLRRSDQGGLSVLEDPLIPGADDDDFIGLQGSFHHFVDLFLQIALMVADHFRFGLCDRMFGHEDRTAVLIGEDGSLIGPDLLGDRDDLLLIKTDQGTEDRQGAYFIGDAQGGQGLGSDLTDALAGDQAQAFAPLRQQLGDPHHIAAHDDGH